MSDMRRMHSIPNGRYSMEMRSGKLLDVDEGFTQLLGYTDEDIKNGLIFKQLMPDVEYNEIIADLRAKFIEKGNVLKFGKLEIDLDKFEARKDGKVLEVVSFVNIQNKLLEGHRVLEVGMADITGYAKPVK